VIGVAVGRYRGVEPHSNVSMIIMRPPQHGHGWGGWPVAAALSGACCLWAVCAGFAAAVNASLKLPENQRFEIVGFLALLGRILWFECAGRPARSRW
jgi:hypothetical protein